MAEETLNMVRPQVTPAAAEPALAAEGVTRSLDQGPLRFGVSGRGVARMRDRLLRHDWREAATMERVEVDVALADRMPFPEASRRLHEIHKAYQIHDQPENIIEAFNHGFFVFFGVHGFSVLTPMDKAAVVVAGNEFALQKASEMMGPIPRQFGRGLATLVVDALKTAVERGQSADATDLELDLCAQVCQMAARRGARRRPHLGTEVAPYDPTLTTEELDYALAVEAKALATTTNAVEANNHAQMVVTKDELLGSGLRGRRAGANEIQYTV